MDNAVARVIGGIYLALSDAIGPDAAMIAHGKLFSFAANPDLPAEDRRIYGCLAHSASLTQEEAAVRLLDKIEDESGAVMADRTLAYLRRAMSWYAGRQMTSDRQS